jgi:uncharacterized protein (UPF0262 family)
MIVDFQLIESEPGLDHLLLEERTKAVHDILEGNDFELVKYPGQPLKVTLSVEDAHLYFRFKTDDDQPIPALALSPRPYRKYIQDYFLMVESYKTIHAEGNLFRLEAVDMARRAIHNEAAELLMNRLADKIHMDFETARRLFTLICTLHPKQGKQLKTG